MKMHLRYVYPLLTFENTGIDNYGDGALGFFFSNLTSQACFIAYQTKLRGGAPPDQEHLDSVMMNQAPGAANLAVLSFSGGFHGRTMGTLSASRSKALHKADVPHFDWPMAPFPK